MKKSIAALGAVTVWIAFAGSANAQINTLFNVNFNAPTYTDAALNDGVNSQDNWLASSGTGTNNILVSNSAVNGFVSLTTSGQDVRRLFDGAATVTSGSVFFDANVTVSSAQATGDYALHFSDGGTSLFYGRTYFRSSGAGFQMALGTSSGTPVNYGATELNFGQTYRVLVRYDFVPGVGNDTGALYIDPTTVDGSGDTPYVLATTIGTDAAVIGALALRQGTAANAAMLTVDNYRAFTVVPEPASLTLLGFTVVGIAARRWRKKK